MIHIYPINDLKEHILDYNVCECEPRVEFKDIDTNDYYLEPLIIHNSFDFRECWE